MIRNKRAKMALDHSLNKSYKPLLHRHFQIVTSFLFLDNIENLSSFVYF